MSPMKDQVDKLKGLLKGRLDKVLVGILGLFLIVVGYMTFNEQSTPAPVVPEPTPVDAKGAIKVDDDLYKSVVGLAQKSEGFDLSPYEPLARFNMFDPKAAKDSKQLQQDADKLLGQAQEQFDQGKYTDAQALVDQALKIMISHKGAQALREEIKKKLQPEPKKPEAKKPGAPSPPAAPPAAGAKDPAPKPK